MLALATLATLLAATASLPFSLAHVHDSYPRSILGDLESKLEALLQPLLDDLKRDVIPALECGACLGLVTAMKVSLALGSRHMVFVHLLVPLGSCGIW